MINPNIYNNNKKKQKQKQKQNKKKIEKKESINRILLFSKPFCEIVSVFQNNELVKKNNNTIALKTLEPLEYLNLIYFRIPSSNLIMLRD